MSVTSVDTARGGLRVVANVVEQMFYKIQRLLLQQEQKSKMQQQQHWQQWSRPEMQKEAFPGLLQGMRGIS